MSFSWGDLGVGENGLPTHLPLGVTAHGLGPAGADEADRYVCWCNSRECPLDQALREASELHRDSRSDAQAVADARKQVKRIDTRLDVSAQIRNEVLGREPDLHPLAVQLDELARRVVTAQQAKIEEACELALQQGEHGVLVVMHGGQLISAAPSARVPYGELWEVPPDADV